MEKGGFSVKNLDVLCCTLDEQFVFGDCMFGFFVALMRGGNFRNPTLCLYYSRHGKFWLKQV